MVVELFDPALQLLLARFQFAATAAFHFMFVPMSVGIGLIMAIMVTRSHRTKDPKVEAASRLWVKILAAVFVVGVVSGITMEFSFGTNWADYSRFVGGIFGAPLAAEALLAFFMESVFLGILIFGYKKVSARLYLISAWLTWFGSALSALWILIANSWMQTPAGATLEFYADGGKRAYIPEFANFLQAAFNPSLPSRYFHTVLALLVVGAFVAMAISAYYMYKKRHPEFAISTMRLGAVIGAIMTCFLLISAHASAVIVAEEQPTKFAMMQGMYEEGVADLHLIGFVDEANEQVVALSIPGGSSFLAAGNFDEVYPGLNDLAKTEQWGAIGDVDLNVNLVYQSYHLMVILFGLIALIVILALIFSFRKGKITEMKWLQRILIISPVFPMLAIQSGWMTAEYGRQPWVVYPSVSGPEGIHMLTSEGVSQVVSAPELMITLALFALVYTFLFVALLRVVFGFIKKGPILEGAEGVADDDAAKKPEGAQPKVEAAAAAQGDDLVKEGE
ncbi:MAG: cytochrome ubiquinol oxidase subunit I [Coriobacteriia bacterium]|nr:cytochrome ubiquinol oxidase subunit I [Coriobacteriia bacterium]MCL2750378.1 cytochrome ubiquinol oxidase subunit I [Coriobacteriia bacterium]